MYSGISSERNLSGDSLAEDTSTAGKSDSSSSKHSKSGKLGHNHALSILGTRLFDDKIPFRKKVVHYIKLLLGNLFIFLLLCCCND